MWRIKVQNIQIIHTVVPSEDKKGEFFFYLLAELIIVAIQIMTFGQVETWGYYIMFICQVKAKKQSRS